MASDLLSLSRIASAAMTVMPIAKMVNAMATVQSNLSANQSSQSPIEIADRAQRRIFVASVIFGLVAALVGATFAWLLWRANNTYQATVKAVIDAEAKRIETEAGVKIAQAQAVADQAKEGAASADERASKADQRAGEANERAATLELRAQELERQNLEVRSGVANLEKEAADARAEQQKIQTELARQQERTANAERELAEVKRRQEPRTFFSKEALDSPPFSTLTLMIAGRLSIGADVLVVVKSTDDLLLARKEGDPINVLLKAFGVAHLRARPQIDFEVPEGTLRIVIPPKP